MFNGLIKSQTEDAYRSGGEAFGGGPMVVDGGPRSQSDGGAYQSTQMHMARQQRPQQQTYQPDYQRQHFDRQEAERLGREREEAANREMERERQELTRQQQLHQQREIQQKQVHEQDIQRQQEHDLLRQQRAQQEIMQQQQQLDIRRQQEKHQQQMQDQYRQQLEIQQRQLQQRQRQQAVPQYRQQSSHDQDQSQMLVEAEHGMMASAVLPIQRLVSHSQSQPNIHHTFQQQRQRQYQPMHHADATGLALPPVQRFSQHTQQRHSLVAKQPQQPQQHSMYAVPPEYSQYPSSESIQPSASPVNYVPPSTSPANYISPSTSVYVPPTPISATSSTGSYIAYWPAASNSFAMPDQQPTGPSSGSGGSAYGTSGLQQYTPEGALRGIAADDHSLQETWQSFMNKVTLQFVDDVDPLSIYFSFCVI